MQPATPDRTRVAARSAGLAVGVLLLVWLIRLLLVQGDEVGNPAAGSAGPAGADASADASTAGPAAHLAVPPASATPDDPEPMPATCPPLTLRGRVRDPDGRPLAGASVLLPQGMLDRSRWERATTAADGSYALAFTRMAPPGAEHEPGAARRSLVEAEFSAAGHMPARAHAAFVGQEQRPASLDVTLPWSVVLAGRVAYADGVPCADAALQVERPVAPGARGWAQQGRQLGVTRTDAQGAFRVELAGGQAVELSVDVDGYVPQEPRRVELPERGEAGLMLELPRPAALQVHLSGGADEAWGGWSGRTPRLLLIDPYAARGRGATQPILSREVVFEDVDPSPAWDVVLSLPAGGRAVLRSGLRLQAGAVTRLDLELDDALLARLREPRAPPPRPTATFAWRLTDESGATLSLAELSRRAEVGDGARLRARARSLGSGELGDVQMGVAGTSTASGTGQVLGVAPPVELELVLGDSVLRHGPLVDGDEVRLVVSEPQGWATLHLRASDGHGAARLPPLVWLWSLDEPRARLVFPDDTTATCSARLPPGDWVVQADPVGEAGAQVRLHLEVGEVRTLDLPCGATGLVRGRVEPPPAEGEIVVVQAQPEHAAAFGPASQARAAADGGFELAGLAAGPWRLVALRGAADAAAELSTHVVQVQAGRATQATLAAAPATEGRPVELRRAGATPGRVRLERLDDGLVLSWLLEPGEPRRLRLPPGRWRCATLPVTPQAWPSEVPPVTAFEVRAGEVEVLAVDA